MRRRSKLLIISFIGTAGLLVLGSLGFLILWSMGTTSGDEFSPDDFSRRHFEESKVAGLNIVISPSTETDTTDSVGQLIQSLNILPAVDESKRKWHLVAHSGGISEGPEYDARILCDLLSETDDAGNLYWESWSVSHPGMAKLLWNHTSQLGKDYFYWAIADLMKMARRSSTASEYSLQAEVYLAQIYFERGERCLRDEDFVTAREMLDRSINYRASRSAHQSRARVLDRLDEPDLAKSDRPKAANKKLPE